MKKADKYINRTYRTLHKAEELRSLFVKIKDTDLHILADNAQEHQARDLALQYRLQIENYINRYPHFLDSLAPLEHDPLASPIVKEMIHAGKIANVGPMAAVAGATAEFVGRGLEKLGCAEVIVENGGDLYLSKKKDSTVAIFAGESPLSLRFGINVQARDMPLGVCTSSGTVGHSLSLGKADSVTVVAKSTAVADAMATALGNMVGNLVGKETSRDSGIKKVLDFAQSIDEILGVIIVYGDQVGAVGEVELVRIE